MKLTKTEELALSYIVAKQQQANAEIASNHDSLAREVEARLDMPDGAIGTTHTFNVQTMSVQELEKESQNEPT